MQQPATQLINTFRCNRNWEIMPITEHGRYCEGCKKEVRDFTGMAPEQVLQIIQLNAGKVCGRIEAHKVEYRPELHQRTIEKVWFKLGGWYKLATAAATAFLMLFSGKLSAQEVEKPKQEVAPKINAKADIVINYTNYEKKLLRGISLLRETDLNIELIPILIELPVHITGLIIEPTDTIKH